MGGSTGFCQKLSASKSVGGSDVRARHNNKKGYCGLSFDKKNWKNTGVFHSRFFLFFSLCRTTFGSCSNT